MAATTDSVTRLINAAAAGEKSAGDELLTLIYEELRALARARVRQAPPGVTLRPTELEGSSPNCC